MGVERFDSLTLRKLFGRISSDVIKDVVIRIIKLMMVVVVLLLHVPLMSVVSRMYELYPIITALYLILHTWLMVKFFVSLNFWIT